MDSTHLRQGGYVFGSICLFACLSVCLLATLQMDCDEILLRGPGGKWNK